MERALEYCTYVLISLTDRKLYIGYTTNLDRRLQEHNSGKVMSTPNRELKKICALAGINEVVTEGERTLPKSQLVTTHTARRSAATNLYLEGASLKTIADLGGWENSETLRLYLRASGFDSARLAKDLDFFK
ncbi:MAG: tyrosine-type recombinase/integrase [Phaeodactylibacter sp.]|nr:tyrosine-type recombinase/integrase [Phaeodactylibacter sp.]